MTGKKLNYYLNNDARYHGRVKKSLKKMITRLVRRKTKNIKLDI